MVHVNYLYVSENRYTVTGHRLSRTGRGGPCAVHSTKIWGPGLPGARLTFTNNSHVAKVNPSYIRKPFSLIRGVLKSATR